MAPPPLGNRRNEDAHKSERDTDTLKTNFNPPAGLPVQLDRPEMKLTRGRNSCGNQNIWIIKTAPSVSF